MPRNVLFNLLTSRRFAPLLATQFLGAFHDNIFKNAFVVLILYELINLIWLKGLIVLC